VVLALGGERPEAEHSVLALQLHGHAVGDVIRHQRRDADAEIDVEAVAQLLGSALGHLIAGPSHLDLLAYAGGGGTFAYGALLDVLLGVGDVNDALHKHARGNDVVRVDLAGLEQVLDLGNGDLAGGRHHRVEVARRLPVDEIAFGVALPRMHDREIGDNPTLHDIAVA